MTNAAADFAVTLSRARRAARLTQGQLARRAGVSASFLGELERGDKQASDATKAKINAALIAAFDEPIREHSGE